MASRRGPFPSRPERVPEEIECPIDPQSLYARLLGTDWKSLAEPVRRAHAGAVQRRGRFRVRHGASLPARAVAWLLRLPKEAESVETTLVVTPEGEVERWQRRFDRRRFDSVQRCAGHGLLRETFGPLELTFRLNVEAGGLSFEQRAAELRLGSGRLRLPRLLSPRVGAREEAVGASTRIAVTVRAPLVDFLLEYSGTLEAEPR